MNARMPGQVTAGGKGTIARRTDVLLFRGRVGGGRRLGRHLGRESRRGLSGIRKVGLASKAGVVELSAHFRGLCTGHL
jgi:hypothetical protein